MTPLVSALEFAWPVALWGLVLLVPLVLLHLYHRRRIVVPFLPLLLEAVGPRRPGGGWRKLRDLLPLLLRAGALVAVLLAVAGLRPARTGPPPEALFVVVDADRTARTWEAQARTRYAVSLDLARALVLSKPWAEVSLIEARDSPHVLVAPTEDRGDAVAVLDQRRREVAADRTTAGVTQADLRGAVASARAQAREREAARVVVLTARPFDVPGGAPEVEVWGTGAADDDQGIVAFGLAGDPDGGLVVVRLRVKNSAPRAVQRDLLLGLGGEDDVKRPLSLEAQSEEELLLELTPPRNGAWLRVRLAGTDAYAFNDEAIAFLPPPLRPSVLVVHDGAVRPWTEAILNAMGEEIDAEASGRVRVENLAQAGDRDVVLVDGATLPPGSLRPGSWVFLAPLEGDVPFEVDAPIEKPLVWRSAPDHPLVRDLDLGTAWIARGFPVRAPELVALAEADGRIVVGEGERDGVRYVVFGLDPDRSDLPLRAALPLLVRGAVRRLASAPRTPLEPWYPAGRPLRPALPLPGGGEAELRWEGKTAATHLELEGETFLVPPGAHGRVEVKTTSWTGHTAFLDLTPDLSIQPARPLAEAPPAASPPRDGEGRWRRALLAAAALFLLLDLLVLAQLRRSERKLAPHPSVG